MIHPVVASVPFIQITQNNIPTAPNSSQIRRNSCVSRVHLTFDFVRGLIDFHSNCPYGTTKYESGCLLNSFDLINGPSGVGRALGGDQLPCVAAFGLNPLSEGPTKEYLEGWST